jgi:hypothetical protein
MAGFVVITAQARIRYFTGFLDARDRGYDNVRLLQAILGQVPGTRLGNGKHASEEHRTGFKGSRQ